MQYGTKKIKDVRFGSKNVVKAYYGSKLVWEKEKQIISPILPDDVVDLGLPSGTLWCTHNVGVNNPINIEDYVGNLYPWGSVNTDGTYLEDYDDISGNLEYDAATKILGNSYKTPTAEDYEELLNNTTFETITDYNNISGLKALKFTGRNGNYLFMPYYQKYLTRVGRYLWTSQQIPDNTTNVKVFDCFSSSITITVKYNFTPSNIVKNPIRPVYKPEGAE